MIQTADIPYGEWLPDQPDYKNPGLTTAQNVIASARGYNPFPGPNGTGDTVTGAVRGASMFFDASGNAVYVGGTVNSLFVRQLGTISTTAASTLGSGDFWRFARFNSFLVAVSSTNNPQYLTDLSSDTTWSALPGSPPKARVVGVIGRHLMLGDLEGNRTRVQWSAYNDPTATWEYNKRKQSGFFDFPASKGNVTGFADADVAPVTFQERAVWRFTPVGGATIFRRDAVSEAIGCIAPGSIVTRGQDRYFLSQEGFHVTNGAGLQDISNQRVFDFFIQSAEPTTLQDTHGVWDIKNSVIRWAYKSKFGGGDFDAQLLYNYKVNRWTSASTRVLYLTAGQQDAVTFDNLTTQFGDVDSITGYTSWDDPALLGQGNIVGAWCASGSNSELCFYNGDNLNAFLVTGDFQPAPGRRSMVTGARPLCENISGTSTVAIGGRSQTPGAPITFTGKTAAGADGFSPQRLDAAFFRVQHVEPPSAQWDKASGVQVRFRVSGAR